MKNKKKFVMAVLLFGTVLIFFGGIILFFSSDSTKKNPSSPPATSPTPLQKTLKEATTIVEQIYGSQQTKIKFIKEDSTGYYFESFYISSNEKVAVYFFEIKTSSIYILEDKNQKPSGGGNSN